MLGSVQERSFTIDVIRHAQKGSDGMLTQGGISNAINLGETLKPENGRFKVYTSNIQRAIESGNLISHAGESQYSRRTRTYLSEYPYTDERITELGLSEGKWMFVNEGNEHLPSVKVIAGKLAKFILDQQEIISRVNNEETFHTIAVTHGPTISCFILQVLANQMSKEIIDEEVVEKMKDVVGSWLIEPLHGFRISVPSEGNSILTIGNLTLPLDRTFLEELKTDHDEWVKAQ